MVQRSDSVQQNLELAVAHVVPAPGREPWTYGWAYEDYRHSGNAAFDGPSGPLSISTEGLDAFDNAMNALLKEAEVRKRWSGEELWGLLATMTGVARGVEDQDAFIRGALRRVREAPQALSVVLIANVSWSGPPLDVASMVVGHADRQFLDEVRRVGGSRLTPDPALGERWLREQVAPRVHDPSSPAPVAVAMWGWGQSTRATEEVERRVRNLVDLCLLLEPDLEGHELYRRGATNRPGVRGLTLDRGAVGANLQGPGKLELFSQPLVVQDLSGEAPVHWYGAEPMPLGDLLSQPVLRQSVVECFGEDPIASRLRVAARWFAESHYASDYDDAALALGVALDAMLSGKDSLPGSALADRFAMLESVPEERAERVKKHLSLYKVRSSVAHGGASSSLSAEFINDFASEVQWVAQRLLAFRVQFAPAAESDIRACFDELRWGIRTWST
ncbi:HEPN domain-containing protein [Cellulomonas sp. FA1]|uniref:HEPN domain-containing protein n=1 Tax=Cellulomonas sp. FA1 TaxID=1346710 RepID=UPI00128BD1AC|nr:HEPN domain-containing protein [Cellulomonas sp. FA1]